MDLGRDFRRFSRRDLAWFGLRLMWPTTLVALTPAAIYLVGGWVAVASMWPPLLGGWCLAAIGQPVVATREFAHRHILSGRRRLLQQVITTGAVGLNAVQTWVILGLLSQAAG